MIMLDRHKCPDCGNSHSMTSDGLSAQESDFIQKSTKYSTCTCKSCENTHAVYNANILVNNLTSNTRTRRSNYADFSFEKDDVEAEVDNEEFEGWVFDEEEVEEVVIENKNKKQYVVIYDKDIKFVSEESMVEAKNQLNNFLKT